jgi:CRP-like cAMP-binding protein
VGIPSDLQTTFRAVPALAGLRDRDLEKVWGLGSVQNLAAGTTLTMQGRQGLEVYLILEGTVEVRLPTGEIHEAGVGEFIGEMAILNETQRSATARTSSSVKALVFDHARFDKLIDEHPSVLKELTRQLSNRLRARDTTQPA